MVFDDAVEHDRDLSLGAQERVGVALQNAAVGGPARMANACPALTTPVRQSGTQARDVAHRPRQLQAIVALQAYSCRVIAAVLQAFEAVKQQRRGLPRANIADHSTHSVLPCLKGRWLSTYLPKEHHADHPTGILRQ